MNAQTFQASGYGVNLNFIALKKGKALWDGLMKILEGTKVKKDLLKRMENSGYEKNWRTVAEEMAEEYYSVWHNGLGFLIAEAINEKEHIQLTVFSADSTGSNSMIAVSPCYPFKQIPKNLLKSEDEYRAIFEQYLEFISEDTNIPVDYMSATYCA